MSSSAACSICTPTEWHLVGAIGIAVAGRRNVGPGGSSPGAHLNRTNTLNPGDSGVVGCFGLILSCLV